MLHFFPVSTLIAHLTLCGNFAPFSKCIANIRQGSEIAKFSALTKVKVAFSYCTIQKFYLWPYIIMFLDNHARAREGNFFLTMQIFSTSMLFIYKNNIDHETEKHNITHYRHRHGACSNRNGTHYPPTQTRMWTAWTPWILHQPNTQPRHTVQRRASDG